MSRRFTNPQKPWAAKAANSSSAKDMMAKMLDEMMGGERAGGSAFTDQICRMGRFSGRVVRRAREEYGEVGRSSGLSVLLGRFLPY